MTPFGEGAGEGGIGLFFSLALRNYIRSQFCILTLGPWCFLCSLCQAIDSNIVMGRIVM